MGSFMGNQTEVGKATRDSVTRDVICAAIAMGF